MENKKRNWEAPQIITVNPEQTESGSSMYGNEGLHGEFSTQFCFLAYYLLFLKIKLKKLNHGKLY